MQMTISAIHNKYIAKQLKNLEVLQNNVLIYTDLYRTSAVSTVRMAF
jgi:hypothetical protein